MVSGQFVTGVFKGIAAHVMWPDASTGHCYLALWSCVIKTINFDVKYVICNIF